MITFLQGLIAEREATRVVLDVGGVGYELFIPLSSYDKLPALGEQCKIFVYENVREDAYQLFGFITEEERKMFLLLISVNGIGPKIALGVLSALSVDKIKEAIIQEDTEQLRSISGIGQKLAQRIIVELRDRVADGQTKDSLPGRLPAIDKVKMQDAILALSALGFKQVEARKMIQHAIVNMDTSSLSVEDIVRRALMSSAKHK